MANSYHDETGRFCSANEMGLAIERLENSENSSDKNKAFEMREEMHKIQRAQKKEEKVVSRQKKIDSFFNDTLFMETPAAFGGKSKNDLQEQWDNRPAYFSAWDKAKLLESKSLTASLRDEIISTLNFDDRYNILAEWRNHYSPETVHALLVGQENKIGETLRGRSTENLYDEAMTFLPERDSRKWAGRSPALAEAYWKQYHKRKNTWLHDPAFEKQIFARGAEYADVDMTSAIASHSLDVNMVRAVVNSEGGRAEAIVAAASSPVMDHDLAADLVKRGGDRLGSYREIRAALLKNPATPKDVKKALAAARWAPQEHETAAIEAEDENRLNHAQEENYHFIEADSFFHEARGPYANMGYWELQHKKTESYAAVTVASAIRDSRKETFDSLLVSHPEEGSSAEASRNYRLEYAQSYLQQQGDLAAIRSLNAAVAA